MKDKWNNIVFFSNGSIGDFLMTIYLFENIRAQYSATFYIIVPRGKKFLDTFCVKYPFIEVKEINRKNIISQRKFILSLMMSKTLSFTHHTFTRLPLIQKITARFVSLRGQSIGFHDEAGWINHFFYSKLVFFDYKKPVVENLQKMAATAGVTWSVPNPTFTFDEVPGDYGEYIVVHPVAASRGRSLPDNRWKDLIQFLTEEMNIRVVITGGPGDEEHLKSYVVNDRVELACGLSVPEIATRIKYSKLFVGVDTGISHLAAFLGKKMVLIGQLSNPSWLPYYNKKAVILFNKENCTCPGYKHTDCEVEVEGGKYLRCMIDIPQEKIKTTIKDVIDN